MSTVRKRRFSDQFKAQAVKRVTDDGQPVAKVAGLLGVSPGSVYAWVSDYFAAAAQRELVEGHSYEIRRLEAELSRVTHERDLLRKLATYLSKPSQAVEAEQSRWNAEFKGGDWHDDRPYAQRAAPRSRIQRGPGRGRHCQLIGAVCPL